MRRTIAILMTLLLADVALAARCPRPCQKAIVQAYKACKEVCPPRKAGRDCRRSCVAGRQERRRTCRATVDPTPPLCGTTPVLPPITTTSAPSTSTTAPGPVTTSTAAPTTTTTTQPCVPQTCAGTGTECGAIDDGCGGTEACGGCPAELPVCIAGACQEECAAQANGTPCDSDGNLCVIEQCSGGTCEITGTVFCAAPAPCYSTVACNPTTGACESEGYVGDGIPCGGGGLVLLPPNGVCVAGACATGKACAIDGVAYASGDPHPGAPCLACQPGLSATAWTPATNGSPCPGGLCLSGACSDQICLIGGVLYEADTLNPGNPCQSCQPGVHRTAWSPVTTGSACADGLCVAGTCDAGSCVIGGVAYPDGAANPGNPCQICNVSVSRTGWQTRPNNTTCGSGCLFGVCQAGGCFILGGSCGSTDCGNGVCNPTTGQCELIPKNVGGACSQISVNGCTATQGTCSAAGTCVRPALTGSPCMPGNQGNPCWSTTEGTCSAAGACVASWFEGASCRPAGGGDLCKNYICAKNSPTTIACQFSSDVQCPPAPAGCGQGVCNSVTGACDYGPYPNGTRACEGFEGTSCCPGQICAFPSTCGQFCLTKYCYYPGAPMP